MLLDQEEIYSLVCQYCKDKGLIDQLENSHLQSADHGFNDLNISEDGLRLMDAVHCLYDKNRTQYFLSEIEKYVNENSVVAEAGIGTGILSLFAATRAKKVYGYEINPSILSLAKDVSDYLTEKKCFKKAPPEFSIGDATLVSIPEQVDVLISENIYTGMFFEKQVQINNNLINFLKPGGVVIPSVLNSYAILSHTKFPDTPKHLELLVPATERGLHYDFEALSNPILYDQIRFNNLIPEHVEKEISIEVIKSGLINSIVIYSDVVMPSGIIIGRKDTIFLNSDIIIALLPELRVGAGDRVGLKIAYSYGDRPQNSKIELRII